MPVINQVVFEVEEREDLVPFDEIWEASLAAAKFTEMQEDEDEGEAGDDELEGGDDEDEDGEDEDEDDDDEDQVRM